MTTEKSREYHRRYHLAHKAEHNAASAKWYLEHRPPSARTPVDPHATEKVCTRCRRTVSIGQFSVDRKTRDGLALWCKDCRSAHYKIYREASPERYQGYQLKKLYGLTLERYAEMLSNQRGACAVCGGVNACGYVLGVDHDHKSGQIRGLLCGNCNNGIGRFNHDVGRLLAAARYLRQFL